MTVSVSVPDPLFSLRNWGLPYCHKVRNYIIGEKKKKKKKKRYDGTFGAFGAVTAVFGLLGVSVYFWGKNIRQFTSRLPKSETD